MDSKPQIGEERRERAQLELREDRRGLFYALDGNRLENGDAIELLLGDGSWLRGAYEWRGVPVVWPALRIGLAGFVSPGSDRPSSTAMPLPPAALIRRPLSASTSDV